MPLVSRRAKVLFGQLRSLPLQRPNRLPDLRRKVQVVANRLLALAARIRKVLSLDPQILICSTRLASSRAMRILRESALIPTVPARMTHRQRINGRSMKSFRTNVARLVVVKVKANLRPRQLLLPMLRVKILFHPRLPDIHLAAEVLLLVGVERTDSSQRVVPRPLLPQLPPPRDSSPSVARGQRLR